MTQHVANDPHKIRSR